MLKRHKICMRGWKRPTEQVSRTAEESVKTILRAKLNHDDKIYALKVAGEFIRQVLDQEREDEERLSIELDQ